MLYWKHIKTPALIFGMVLMLKDEMASVSVVSGVGCSNSIIQWVILNINSTRALSLSHVYMQLHRFMYDTTSSSGSSSSSSTTIAAGGTRALSINLGNGNCEYTQPDYNLSPTLDLHKTLIVGYPSGDKRLIFQQMEALTGFRK